MNLKKISVLAVVTVMLFLLLMIPSFASGHMEYANEAPGGVVSNADEFIAALGKENAVKVSENEIKLINSVVLESTITITNGTYTLNSLGCTIYRGFEQGALFLLDGSTISQRPSLSFGRVNAEMTASGIEPDLTIDGCKELYPKAEGSLIMLKGSAVLNVYGRILLTNAANAMMGGAIFAEIGTQDEGDYNTPLEPTVNLKNCKIEKCSAEMGGGAVAFIGYYNMIDVGFLSIQNVSFTGNTSVNELGMGAGGAIYSVGGTVNVATAMFTECVSDKGGAMYIASEAILSDVTAENNLAKVGGGVLYVGAEEDIAGNVTLNNMYATNNKSDGDAGVIENNGTVTANGIYFSNNECSRNGGTIYNSGTFIMKEGSILHNDAGFSGGGVYSKGKNSVFKLEGGEINSNDSVFAGAIYSDGLVEITGGAVGRNDSAEPHLVLKGTVKFGKNANVLGSNTIGLCITKDKEGNENVPIIEIDGASTILDYMYVGFFREKTDKDGNVTGYKTANKSGRAVFVGNADDIKNSEKWYIVYSNGLLSYTIKENGTLSPRFLFLPIWAWGIIIPVLGAGGFFGYKKISALVKKKKAAKVTEQ